MSKEEIKDNKNEKKTDLSFFVAELDRYQISDRAGAALVTAILRGQGKVTDDDMSEVIDRYKIRSERKKRQKEKKRKRFNEASGQLT